MDYRLVTLKVLNYGFLMGEYLSQHLVHMIIQS